MIRPQHHVHRPFPCQQALQLEDPFARHDDLLFLQLRPFEHRLAQRQPVPIGRHRANMLPTCFQQHPVQVIPHILLRH